MRRLSFGLFILALAWIVPMRADAQPLEPDVAALVNGNNEFALNLYRAIAAKQKGNVFFSPYSISNALAMTYAGARGNTAKEMKATLHFDLPDDALPVAFAKLITQLDGDSKRPFQLTVANRLWGQKGYGFLPEFTRIGGQFYRAGLEELDFIRESDPARRTINAWVEKQTNDKIKNLLPPGVIDAQTRLILTNAIYFKAPWQNPFQPRATKPTPFYLAGDKTVDTPMMRLVKNFPFAAFDDFLMLQLPYKGNGASMIVLLPAKKDALPDLEKQLTAATLAKWLPKLNSQSVDVQLPKFKVTTMASLEQILKQMGMREAFATGTADFSGMATGENLNISAVLHKAFVDVNESGTEAAAATGVGIKALAARVQRPTPFIADHPFIYLIRDNTTGTILFAGRLTDPGK